MAAQLQTFRSGATQVSEEMVNFIDHRLISVSGVTDISGTFFQVQQETVPAMSVKVKQGYAYILGLTGAMAYPVSLTIADASVAITSNASGNSRIDSIVLYINLGAAANPAATNVATLVAVAGTPAGSPVAPNSGAIQTAIGASNPYIVLGNVTVSSGAVSIVTANISDQRTQMQLLSSLTDTAKLSNPYKFYVYRNAAQNTGNGAFAVVNFDTTIFDTSSNVDITTNKGRFTAPIAGFYQFDARVASNGTSIAILKIALYKNGSEIIRGDELEPSGSPLPLASARISVMLQLAANDYVEVYSYGDTAKALQVGNAIQNYFQGHLISAT